VKASEAIGKDVSKINVPVKPELPKKTLPPIAPSPDGKVNGPVKLHPSNALFPILITELGILNGPVKLLHPLNALSPIDVSPAGKVNVPVSPLHPLNALIPILVTDGGKLIGPVRRVWLLKADVAIVVMLPGIVGNWPAAAEPPTIPVIVVLPSVYVNWRGATVVVVDKLVVVEGVAVVVLVVEGAAVVVLVVEGAAVVDVDSGGGWSTKTVKAVSAPSNGCNNGQTNVKGFCNTLNPVYLK